MSYRGDEPKTGTSQTTSSAIPESYSLIDRHTQIQGSISSDRDLRIEGRLRGELHCQGLVQIAEGADVDATVQASRITVAGNLTGTLTCIGRFQILPTGRVRGTLVTKALVINEGAVFEGELRMDVDEAAAIVSPQPEPQAVAREDETTQLLRRISGGDEPGEHNTALSHPEDAASSPPENSKKQSR